MSHKIRDDKNRWRNKTVAFRVSEEEWELLNKFVNLSGMPKQDYLISKIMNKDIVVVGNSRTYKALKTELARVAEELKRIENGVNLDAELLELIKQCVKILGDTGWSDSGQVCHGK